MTFCCVNLQYGTYPKSEGTLDRITLINDIGVFLDPRQKFADHISSMANKARCALGFIKRWSKEFDDPYLLSFIKVRSIFCSL